MKHVHPLNLPDGPGCASCAAIEWPALPWICPSCEGVFTDHVHTVATVEDPETPATLARPRFLCMGCDFAHSFMAN